MVWCDLLPTYNRGWDLRNTTAPVFTLEGHQYAVRRVKVGTALKPVSWEGKGIVGLNATPLFFKTVILSLTSVATMVRGKHFGV